MPQSDANVVEERTATAASSEAKIKWSNDDTVNERIEWCMQNRDAILALYSSPVYTPIFAL